MRLNSGEAPEPKLGPPSKWYLID